MAIIPEAALLYVTPDKTERCYIVNVKPNRSTPAKNEEQCETTLPCGDGFLGVDDDNRVGHWVVLIVGHGKLVEVFDSLGQRKIWNDQMKTFIKLYGRGQSVNDTAIASTNCGFYCLAYAYYRCRGHDPHFIVNFLHTCQDIVKHCSKIFHKRERGRDREKVCKLKM
jgi:hypothetical protein